MHTESDHFLPPHFTTQIWISTFLVWIYWNSLLSDLSASIYVPLTQSSAQKPPGALHFRVVAKFLQMVAEALHDLSSYDLPDLISNYSAWFTQLQPHWPPCCSWKMSLFGKFFPYIYLAHSLSSFKSFLQCHALQEASMMFFESEHVCF